MIFISLLLTTSEGGKLTYMHNTGEKAHLDIAHPIGGLSDALIPEKAINLLKEFE